MPKPPRCSFSSTLRTNVASQASLGLRALATTGFLGGPKLNIERAPLLSKRQSFTSIYAFSQKVSLQTRKPFASLYQHLTSRSAFNKTISRDINSTVIEDEQSEALWRHSNVKATAAGYSGLTLDIYSWKSSRADVKLESETSSPSSQVLGALQLDQSPSLVQALTARANDQNAIIIYLPRGPFPGHLESEERTFRQFLRTLDSLRKSQDIGYNSDITVVKVNYRLSPTVADRDPTENHPYPMPVFDVHWALDYVKVRYKEQLTDGATLSIFGENFGGSLGLSLALTGFDDLYAVTVIDPIIDWTGLDEVAALDKKSLESDTSSAHLLSGASLAEDENPEENRRKGRSISREKSKAAYRFAQARAANQLINLRTNLFNSPSGFFDRFASPLLFLRAPGKDTPLWRTAKPEIDESAAQHSVSAYGPYDDDWSAKPNDLQDEESTVSAQRDDGQLDTLAEAIGTDAIAYAPTTTPDQDGTEASREDSTGSQATIHSNLARSRENLQTHKVVKRRKVLLRWPSVGTPDEALLPYVRIMSTLPKPIDPAPDLQSGQEKGQDQKDDKIDYATILHPQAKEMAEVMRRACFWGRGSDLAEERVTFETIEPGVDGRNRGIDAAVSWLNDKLRES